MNLVPQVVDILEERQKSQRRKSRRKTLVESNFVFPGTGKTGHVTDYKKQWRSLLRAAKLDYPNGERLRPTLHDLRRSFGTHMLNNGFPLEVVSKMLGHANIAITSRAYAHVSNEAARSRSGRKDGGGARGNAPPEAPARACLPGATRARKKIRNRLVKSRSASYNRLQGPLKKRHGLRPQGREARSGSRKPGQQFWTFSKYTQ